MLSPCTSFWLTLAADYAACSAVTRCAGPFGANKKEGNIGQLGKTGTAVFMQNAIAQAGSTYWGGDAGTVCNTVLLKPIMTCGDGCISDNRWALKQQQQQQQQ